MSIREKFLADVTAFDVVPFEGYFLRPLKKDVFSECEAIISDEHRSAKQNTRLRWVALRWGLVEENGEPILTVDDRDSFGSWDHGRVEKLFAKILEISDVTPADKEEFEKN